MHGRLAAGSRREPGPEGPFAHLPDGGRPLFGADWGGVAVALGFPPPAP